MPRSLKNNLVNWKVPVTYFFANRVSSIFGQTGFTHIYVHSQSHKDMMNMLMYVIERDLGPYTELDPKRTTFGKGEWVGDPNKKPHY